MARNPSLATRLRSCLSRGGAPDASAEVAPVEPDEEWEVASVLGATSGGLFGASALRYDVLSTKEIAEKEARSLEAVTGRETIVRTVAEAREAAQKEQEDFDCRLEARMARMASEEEEWADFGRRTEARSTSVTSDDEEWAISH